MEKSNARDQSLKFEALSRLLTLELVFQIYGVRCS